MNRRLHSLLTDLAPDFSVRERDELVIVGPSERVDQFRSTFGPN